MISSCTSDRWFVTGRLGFACVVFHYVKREVESVFVHRFSNDTMPWFNIIKNSSHYWVLSGLFLAYPLYHPQYSNTLSPTLVHAGVAVFLLAELGNGWAHIVLMNLRPAGTRQRGIPKGGLFNIVSCANYTYELLAWLAFSYFTHMLTGTLAAFDSCCILHQLKVLSGCPQHTCF